MPSEQAMEAVRLMGKVVTVSAVYRRRCKWPKKEWVRDDLRHPWAGWVTGYRYKQDGLTVMSDYPEWQATGRKFALMVARWPSCAPVPVPLDAVREGGEPKPSAQAWSDEQRHNLSAESMRWPRDERGRWT